MKQYNIICSRLTLLFLISFFTIAAKKGSLYQDPVKVAQAFINALVDGKQKKMNAYMVQKLHYNNHWINATKKDRKKNFSHWKPIAFRKKGKNTGYVIIDAPYGHLSIKFLKVGERWLWANE